MKPRSKPGSLGLHALDSPRVLIQILNENSPKALLLQNLWKSLSSNEKNVPIICLQCAAVCTECATVGERVTEAVNATLRTPAPTATSVSPASFLNALPDRIGTDGCISTLCSHTGALHGWGTTECVPGRKPKIKKGGKGEERRGKKERGGKQTEGEEREG